MPEQSRSGKQASRGRTAARFDEITLAAFVVAMVVTIAFVFTVGVATAEDRIGCGLNNLVNGFLAYPRPCH